jgi:histidine ammonia-lyase
VFPVISVDGGRLTVADIVAAADGAPVELGDRGRARADEAHRLAVRISGERPVYGRTTGVGANKDAAVDRSDTAGHGRRILLSHATSAGPVRDARRVRATMAIRLNQLAAGGSGARVEVLDALVALLSSGAVPPVREHGGIGTGDLAALATIGLALPGVEWTADDALPFLSSNAATLADAALATAALLDLAQAQIAVAALTFVAAGGQPEAFSETVETVSANDGVRVVCTAMRRLVAGGPEPRRLQDPFALRCLPQVHGLVLDTLREVGDQVEVAASTAAENPVVDRARQVMAHHGGFHAAYLTSVLDAARAALAGSAGLSLRRVGLLLDPEVTGLAAFLGDGTPGASGAMGLEYAAASALGDLRALAGPAALQTAVLSRGVEDDASYASLAARQALDARSPYAVVLACELVGALRAVRLGGLEPPDGGWGAVVRACAALPGAGIEPGDLADLGDLADRDLTPDLEAAAALLPGLAVLGGHPPRVGAGSPPTRQ